MVRRIVQRCGGRIWAEMARYQGASRISTLGEALEQAPQGAEGRLIACSDGASGLCKDFHGLVGLIE